MAEADEETSTPRRAWSAPVLNELHHITARFDGAGNLLLRTLQRFGWVERFDDVKLRRGRPPEYDRAIIVQLAEELIAMGVDDYLDRFVERVRNVLSERHIKSPGDTLLTEICAPIYRRAAAR